MEVVLTTQVGDELRGNDGDWAIVLARRALLFAGLTQLGKPFGPGCLGILNR